MKKHSSRQNGFTLVEMAIVLLIIGTIIGGLFSFLSMHHQQQAEQITKDREQKIAYALANYAQMHYLLPCPSLPNPAPLQPGVELGSCNTPQQRMGIVPYRTLGLSQLDVTDGWNNPISYGVAQGAHTPVEPVEDACRTPAWISSVTGLNINPAKAKFCCQRDDTMSVTNKTSVPVLTAKDSGAYIPPIDTAYQSVNTPAVQGNLNRPLSLSNFSYILISHGKNGLGAFKFCEDRSLPSCNNNRPNLPAFDNINESKNALSNGYPANTDFYEGPRSTSLSVIAGVGQDYFDDIILWRTQDHIMSEFNNDSCAQPTPLPPP